MMTLRRAVCERHASVIANPLSPSVFRLIAFPTYKRHTSTQEGSRKPAQKLVKHADDKEKEPWMVRKAALATKFGATGWQPRKRLSPDAMEGIRALHAQDSEQYSVTYLANQFELSPDAIRRILKSKWRPTPEESTKRYERWERRGQSVWKRWAELGYKAPKKWRGGLTEDAPMENHQFSKSQKSQKKASQSSALSHRFV